MGYLQIILDLPIPLNQSFTYKDLPQENDSPRKSKIGFRAEIKFGNRKTTGCIIGESDEIPESCPVEKEKIRPILKIIDKEPLFTKENIELAQWMSSYYICTIGEALFSMLPGARRETDAGGFSFTEETPDTTPRSLSDEQEKAVMEITGESTTSLHYLFGPTGSGKTEVFLQTAQKFLDEGKGVIYLVPEIGLTAQVIEAVVSRFGNTAAVLHSGLTPSQKLQQWRRILSKESRVVIGARSAVFAPVPDLGLIIIDEEHDASYKSDSTPRYHARQVAMHRCSKLKIPLLMGSATPSVESYHLMESGAIKKHVLTKRLSGGAMPKIKTIDLSNEKIEGCISKELENEINETLAQKRQTILFLNRRGFNHFFRCNTCGYELKCKNCSVPMTFHKSEKRLRCHYCGWSTEPPYQCPSCASLDVGYSGFGTEFIETEVTAKFPNAKVLRLDTDSLTKKGELQEKISEFRNGNYDILLGTQMVAKGLNFPNLKLVGVVLADTGLHLPDFRSGERTFSLITQVSGRAGRFFPDGKVLIQSYSPSREPILFASQNRTEEFYKNEIKQREILGFPPFSRIIRIVFRSMDQKISVESAESASKILDFELKKTIDEAKSQGDAKKIESFQSVEILGPSDCPLSKVASNFRTQILLRAQNITAMQYLVKKLVYNYQIPQKVYLEIDVDAIKLL